MDSKNCSKCGRTIEYRKKWQKSWSEIKYCSDKCRNSKTKQLDHDFEEKILNLLSTRARDSSICPSEILPTEEKQNKEPMELVRQAARRLVHQNKLVITQKSQIVDPSNFKGPIRLKLK